MKVSIACCFSLLASVAAAQTVGTRTFSCVPKEVYQVTSEGMRMAPEDVFTSRTEGRDFVFDEATGVKSEPKNGKTIQYQIINPGNLVGTPVVAQYGNLNPSFLRLAMIDENDPTKFIFFLFGGSISIFGNCSVVELPMNP